MKKQDNKKNPKQASGTARFETGLRKNHLWLAGILAITLIAFLPAVRNLFITFDDMEYVVENPFIKGFSMSNLRAIFLGDANNLGNYHPLTLLSYIVNYSFSELHPAAYHLTNILVHLANTLLVFQLSLLLFARLGTPREKLLSAMTALLFGIHPLHVESVAWVSERKDLMYTCFYLLSLISYIRYLDRKATKNYLLSLFFFIMSLFSKGMAVTLSLSLVAVDYLWKRDLLSKKVILEKIPYFLLSFFFGIVAIIVQQAQGTTKMVKFDFAGNMAFASYGYTQYLVKLVVPYKLCGYYPYPVPQGDSVPWFYFLYLVPVLITAGLLVYFILVRPNRTVVFGSMFFIVNVMFVIQLFPVGSAVMADRYTYLSSFGLFFLMAAGMGLLLRKFKSPGTVLLIIFMLYSATLAAVSYQRCSAWHDSFSFWTDVMMKYPAFYPAINNLGVLNEKEGQTQKAVEFYTSSIKVHPDNPKAYYHRGSIYGKSGRLSEAISDMDNAIRYDKAFTQAYINRAIAKAMIKDHRGALADLDWVLAREKNGEAYLNRGILKNELGDYAGAIPDFQEAINLDPSCLKCYYAMGLANFHSKRYNEAIAAFSSCISRDPGSGMPYFYRALSNIEAGRPEEACTDLQKAKARRVSKADPYLSQYCR